MDEQFNKQRVLVTGGAGFIGSHLAETLLLNGHHVTVIDDLSTGRFANIERLTGHPNFRFAIDTITNKVVMDRLVSECDLIVHLAAAVGVMLIVEQPVHTIKNNVMGTEAVLETALRYKKKLLMASTSEVYGKGTVIPFQEDDDIVLGPTSRSRWGYAASKMVDEFLTLAYHQEKDLPVVIFRLFNTVGPRQTGRYGMVIPRFLEQALSGDPITVYGDGLQTRCFMHVQDAVHAILALASSNEAIGHVFNVGTTEEITIRTLAEKVVHAVGESKAGTGKDSPIMHIPYEEAYAAGFEDMRRRVPSTKKIESAVGWKPTKGLDAILKDLIDERKSAA